MKVVVMKKMKGLEKVLDQLPKSRHRIHSTKTSSHPFSLHSLPSDSIHSHHSPFTPIIPSIHSHQTRGQDWIRSFTIVFIVLVDISRKCYVYYVLYIHILYYIYYITQYISRRNVNLDSTQQELNQKRTHTFVDPQRREKEREMRMQRWDELVEELVSRLQVSSC